MASEKKDRANDHVISGLFPKSNAQCFEGEQIPFERQCSIKETSSHQFPYMPNKLKFQWKLKYDEIAVGCTTIMWLNEHDQIPSYPEGIPLTEEKKNAQFSLSFLSRGGNPPPLIG
jgi:hypothetical protein